MLKERMRFFFNVPVAHASPQVLETDGAWHQIRLFTSDKTEGVFTDTASRTLPEGMFAFRNWAFLVLVTRSRNGPVCRVNKGTTTHLAQRFQSISIFSC